MAHSSHPSKIVLLEEDECDHDREDARMQDVKDAPAGLQDKHTVSFAFFFLKYLGQFGFDFSPCVHVCARALWRC